MPTQARTRIPYGKHRRRLLKRAGKFGVPNGRRKQPQRGRVPWDLFWGNISRARSKWKRKCLDEQKQALKRRRPMGDWHS